MRLIVVAGQTALTALGNGATVGTWSSGACDRAAQPNSGAGAIAVY